MGKRKTTTEEKEYINLLDDIRKLSKLPQGRKFIWAVLELCDIYSDVFTGNSHTFYREGRRSVGLELLAMLEEADPTIYPSLIMEHAKKRIAQSDVGGNNYAD